MPAYTLPPDREDLAILRVVCRNGFSQNLADLLFEDLTEVTAALRAGLGGGPAPARSGFHH